MPRQDSGRYEWDFQMLDAFLELVGHYLASSAFRLELRSLWESAPEAIRGMVIDPIRGVVSGLDAPSSLEDLFLPDAPVLPADAAQLTERYGRTWEEAAALLTDDSEWLRQVNRIMYDWGPDASWGRGALVEMMHDELLRAKRTHGKEDSRVPPIFGLQWQLRQIPQMDVRGWITSPPWPYPGMTEGQWHRDVDEFRQEGLAVLARWTQIAPQVATWRARPREQRDHVNWLFNRITPPHHTAPMQAALLGYVSTEAVQAGIRKAARLLGIRVSPGVRHRRKTRGLPVSRRGESADLS